MFSFITNNSLYQNENLRIVFFALGASYFLLKVLNWTKNLLFSLQPSKDLASRYGKNTWALITGGSDGIGKAFAFELASQGFNLILVSRTKQKLEKTAQEIRAKNPSTQIKIIAHDLTDSFKEGFSEVIFNQVKDLDISILINNAGQGLLKSYSDITSKEIRDLVALNCLSHALISQAFLPKLSQRKQRSAVINVSSLAAVAPLPKVQLYAASKAFHDYLSQGLSYEYPNVDIMSLRPGTVSTALSKYRKLDSETVAPEDCAKAALKDLGTTKMSFGHRKHKIQAYFASITPKFILDIYIKKVLLSANAKYD